MPAAHKWTVKLQLVGLGPSWAEETEAKEHGLLRLTYPSKKLAVRHFKSLVSALRPALAVVREEYWVTLLRGQHVEDEWEGGSEAKGVQGAWAVEVGAGQWISWKKMGPSWAMREGVKPGEMFADAETSIPMWYRTRAEANRQIKKLMAALSAAEKAKGKLFTVDLVRGGDTLDSWVIE